jgi:hypothetical protein
MKGLGKWYGKNVIRLSDIFTKCKEQSGIVIQNSRQLSRTMQDGTINPVRNQKISKA